VSDNKGGICRLDQISATDHGIKAASFTDGKGCFPANNNGVDIAGVPDFMFQTATPAGSLANNSSSGFLFVPFSNVGPNVGVQRLTINLQIGTNNPVQTISKAELLVTQDQIAAAYNAVHADAPITAAKVLPAAVAIGGDGNLYVADQINGEIFRVTNIGTSLGSQVVSDIGAQDKGGKFVTGMTMRGSDMYVNGGQFLFRLPAATACTPTSGCVTANLNLNSIASANDKFGNRFMYWDSFGILLNAEVLMQWDAVLGTMKEYSVGTTDPTTGAVLTPYAAVFGVSVDPLGNVYVVDDTGGGVAPDGGRPITPNGGRAFMVAAGSTPFSPDSGRVAPPPPVPPAPPKLAVASLFAQSNQAQSLLFVPDNTANLGNLWVSDKSKGFCLIVPNKNAGSPGTLTNCFKANAGFNAGSAAYGDLRDPNTGSLTRFLYIVDESGSGIYRASINLGSSGKNGTNPSVNADAVNISAGNKLAGTPSAIAVGLEGSIYVGYSNVGTIQKFTTPATSPTFVTKMASTATGRGVLSMAFLGNTLYLIEGQPGSSQASFILNASPSLAAGSATILGGASGHGTVPSFTVANAFSIATDQKGLVYVGNQGGVYTYNLTTKVQTQIANQGLNGSKQQALTNVTAVGLDASGKVYAGDNTIVWRLN
jgi:hypothetical protein